MRVKSPIPRRLKIMESAKKPEIFDVIGSTLGQRNDVIGLQLICRFTARLVLPHPLALVLGSAPNESCFFNPEMDPDPYTLRLNG